MHTLLAKGGGQSFGFTIYDSVESQYSMEKLLENSTKMRFLAFFSFKLSLFDHYLLTVINFKKIKIIFW